MNVYKVEGKHTVIPAWSGTCFQEAQEMAQDLAISGIRHGGDTIPVMEIGWREFSCSRESLINTPATELGLPN